MKKKIAVLTAARAEYGLLAPVIKKLSAEQELDVRVVVTGAHLSPEFGRTYREIEADGIKIDKKIEMLLSSDCPSAISKSMGLALLGFADYFEERRPDALLVLGDRYEALAVCCAAMNARIPILHLYGGETTEGAVDEAIRHSITKMSYLHFTSTEAYRRRVIQLGEEPQRVFTVGALGVENISRMPLMTKEELQESLHFELNAPYAVVTFHPVTLEGDSAGEQTRNLLDAISGFPDMKFIFTKANADENGRIINQMLEDYVKEHENAVVFESLGRKRYLSAVKYSEAVIGNSSSGLIEAPSFHIPTVNIGQRQSGRIRAESVLDCGTERGVIRNTMQEALERKKSGRLRFCENPYEGTDPSGEIVKIIKEHLQNDRINLKKKFYDILSLL